jgi:hypothetical protein
MGFVFEEGKPECPPIQEMKNAIAVDPSCAVQIHRFIGGADLNSLPNLTPDRFIIDLDGLEEDEARKSPELFAIAERYVKPQRLALPNTPANRRLRETWWHFSQGREIREATRRYTRILVCSQTSKYRLFVFIVGSWIFDQKIIGFACSKHEFFAIMQSHIHELSSEFFGSTLGDDPVYNPPKCFETFAFPENWVAHPVLETAGKAYYEFRAAVMVRNDEGLTKTYNHFHDPEYERDPDIVKLHELHAAMDRAVLDAYGWTDLRTDCEFLLDYEIDEEESGNKKKPWRYRWPDEVRDEVLARLLELNVKRAKEEARSGAGAKKGSKKPAAKRAPPALLTEDLLS